MLILHGLVQTRPLKTIKTVLEKQKQAARLMSSDDISDGILARLLTKELKILNMYQINILQHLLFMFKIKNSIIPRAFNQVFSLTDHIYPTRFSDNSFKICDFQFKIDAFCNWF